MIALRASANALRVSIIADVFSVLCIQGMSPGAGLGRRMPRTDARAGRRHCPSARDVQETG